MHFEITGVDGSALQSFYRDLFDWKIDSNNESRYGVVETGGDGGINGGIAGNQDGATGGRVTVYAAVDDMQAYLDKAERLGATVVMPVTEVRDTVRGDRKNLFVSASVRSLDPSQTFVSGRRLAEICITPR